MASKLSARSPEIFSCSIGIIVDEFSSRNCAKLLALALARIGRTRFGLVGSGSVFDRGGWWDEGVELVEGVEDGLGPGPVLVEV